MNECVTLKENYYIFSRHIQEHLDGVVDKLPEEMTPAELKFHYFQTHDFDTDSRLDGLELMHTIREASMYNIVPIC